MFAIYGISGPVFQGTLENLSRFPPVVRRGPPVAARRVGDQVEFTLPPDTNSSTTAIGGQAIEAYKDMLPQSLERGPLYHASQIMQRSVISVSSDDAVAHAWRVLSDNQIHQAPVLDADARLVGIVGERNLLTAINIEDGQVRDALSKRVGDVMTTPVVASSPVTDIRRIARVMLERDVDGVPIVSESGALLGFVSRSDILRAVVSDPPLSVWR